MAAEEGSGSVVRYSRRQRVLAATASLFNEYKYHRKCFSTRMRGVKVPLLSHRSPERAPRVRPQGHCQRPAAGNKCVSQKSSSDVCLLRAGGSLWLR